jgi:repressor LexA
VLTDRQLQVLRLLDVQLPPTLKELAEALGLKAHHTIVCHIKRLEAKGMVTRIPMKSRAVFVTRAGKRALRGAA